jgi:NADH-quinone oxidoreductase subunit J
MAPSILYTACLLGAIGLYLLLRPGGSEGTAARALQVIGAVIGVAVFGYLIVTVGEAVGAPDDADRPAFFYLLFSFIAVASAVKMITTSRPVYSALFFVLVVMASAGLFLLMGAEFMAFALIIVYAGAILITYLFVLMLAQQAPRPDDPTGQPEYDLNPREPLAGAVVAFILLALLTRMIYDGTPTLPAPPTLEQQRVESWQALRLMPRRLDDFVAAEVDGSFELVMAADDLPRLEIAEDGSTAVAWYAMAGEEQSVVLPGRAMPENVQEVGLGLVHTFPVSLELAGVILLLAMFGAVLLARRQIELTEDEKRAAAGMRRVGHHDEDVAEGGSA